MAVNRRAASAVARTERAMDERLGSAAFLRRNIRKAFPEHWSFLLGEIALYCFVTLILTGVFLTLFFKPSQAETVYTGSYAFLHGEKVSEAYASTVHISFDVRGGLLVRQIHHWAAMLFVAAICVHLMRIFFTGAFRKPREINWVIGTTLFALAVAEGFAGYSLPDDLLSGTGLRIMQGIVLSIPLVGTYLSFFVFGGEFPGHDFIPRLFTVHVLLIPGILLALISAHLMIVWHQKHTQWPGERQTEQNVVGAPTYPKFLAHTIAFFLYVLGALALLGTFAQINPIWMYGPYRPDADTSGAQPDWYVGFLEGALRIMPRIDWDFAGHSIAWNVFLPAAVLPLCFFTLIGLYPFFERWVIGDSRPHHLCDRPRNAPTRTALGVAAITWYGNLWAAGGNDVLAEVFKVPLEFTTWFFRVGFFVFPVVAFAVTRRLCLSLQRSDARKVTEGVESGTIKRLPNGEYVEAHDRPEREQAVVARTVHPDDLVEALPDHIIPLPTPRRIIAQVRSRLNRAYTKYAAEVPTPEERRELEERDASPARSVTG
ncbi:cytochrome bc1 complex cytochrome b subunit [Actinoallomurus rhizosphaericola]|uniref:cytochrome bc1 complex cytochrome b subunit n=1 Tax=Actinoallomurus rhizosphaericola TaxID=2952536 RepID=UPI002093C7AE|nr:cytochrome b N-terminal domain-containing protein [Actinoallomurus rhizosphaericola]MCO5997845.1 cytochrome b N-terminal domain-containing protein [Actinoallomurus rhizosphaericola]